MPLSLETLAVFPLFPVRDGACTCRSGTECERPGKHPMFLWSQLEAGEKWAGSPGCGYGIATGSRSGFFVVDLDVRPDRNGVEAFEAMGDCEETYTVHTPTGGYHRYFQLPDFLVRTSGNELAPGIDVRGEGGFVVAQDSPHANGGVYTVALDVPIAKAPAWLLAWAGLKGSIRGGAREAGANAPIPVDVNTEAGKARVAKAIKYLQDAPVAIDGAGGSVCLLRIAIELVRGLELPVDRAYRLLAEHYNERCVPPWSDAELMHKLEDARDRCDRIQGKAPEDWTARVERMAMPTVMARSFDLPDLDKATEEARPRQRVHDPSHKYTFEPGVHPAAADMSKRVSSEIAFILSSNEAWRGVLAYDEFLDTVTAVDPPLQLDAEEGHLSDSDVDAIRMYLQSQGVAASVEDVRVGIHQAAKRVRTHVIKNYLDSCRGKGRNLLATAATVLFGTTEPYANDFFRKMMISAVRRMQNPGSQVDTMLVLVGPEEGEGKSSLCKALFGDFVKSQMPDLATERASHGLKGFWCIEMGELSRLSPAQRDVVWEFLTRRTDDYHEPYGRADVHRKRYCIFIGTTNDEQFLVDAGVNRRFHPLKVSCDIDLNWLRENRDALWGEAVELAEAGEPHWYTKTEWLKIAETLTGFKVQDSWHDAVKEALQGHKRVSLRDVYEALGIGIDRQDGRTQRRLVDTLRRLGCRNIKSEGRMLWLVPEVLSVLPPVNNAQRFAQNVRDLNRAN